MTEALLPAGAGLRPSRRLFAALLLLGAGGAALAALHGGRQAAVWLLGAALGVVLYRATFGFAGAFRRLLAERRSAGLRAQMLLLALGSLLFLPALAAGEVLGQPVRGFVFPIGLALAFGAFLFGIGMQLGGGCASGTLYTAGGGSPRMLVTLLALVAGATLAAWDAERWLGLPSLPPISVLEQFGLAPALLLWLAVPVAIALLGGWLERRRHGAAEVLPWRGGALLRGPWPLLWGAVGLAVLSFVTLWLLGRPWAISAAFPLWGSRLVEALALDDPAFWAYWDEPTRAEALLRPLSSDRTGVMDVGLMLGALLAAGLAARPPEPWRVPLRPLLASVLGGLLLGYGAVMGGGCNISAYVSGTLSGSLHGWAWLLPALLGNWVGLRLRPWFGLANGAAT